MTTFAEAVTVTGAWTARRKRQCPVIGFDKDGNEVPCVLRGRHQPIVKCVFLREAK